MLLTFSIIGMIATARLVATRWGWLAPAGAEAGPLLASAAVAIVALAAMGLVATMRRLALPLRGVMDGADRVAGGDYDVRVAELGPPAIRALVRSFNTMTERLHDHDRVRRDLMADIAHELRTPLAVIQGKLEGLVDGVYPRDEVQLQQLLEETHVLSRLVEDLRTLALSESGALKLQREPTDVAELAREVVRAFAADAASRGVTIEADASSELEPIAVDPVRIREVVGNLVSNALRHTDAGGSVTVRVRAKAGQGVSIDVRDTGIGMAADEVAHAFDRFYKGSHSRGSGLGLTIARNLVVAHGGEIHAASEPGRGTTVTLTLPEA